MLDLLYAAAAATPTPVVPTPTTPAPSSSLDFFSTIMWPFKWIVEAILVFWHWIFTSIGLEADAGLTWVLSIMGLVIVVRSALIPLFVRQIKSQRKMMEIAPELRKVQEKYRGKKDQLSREAMSRETMALYKKHGTTPVSSCLPLLVQMPILLGMFYTLSDVKKHAEWGFGGVGLLNKDLTWQFYEAKLFGVAPLHTSLVEAINQKPSGWEATVAILIVLVVLMIASQFITQLQIISKNLSPEAKTGQAYQMQRIMLYILPLAFIFSGVFFPLGVVLYWFTSNIWTMVQQFLVIRNLPTPGSEAAKAREERLARKGKAIDAQGKIVPLEKYQAEQQRLYEEAQKAKAEAPKRQQPVSKQRAKKQSQQPKNKPTTDS
ncbi:preprotein translocase subunit YidC [Microbacterium sp. oral taxon 186 str. F0373]|uniref:membrane protein insertase YidC n=1 Tax=Microbacterium sp. oral taxon 186 TaxID=712383 RepID=UPI000258666D|nr:membrane protein insertase YidC [Microbacterium sp. oral taxon 186]EIC06505.1 membrane protein insertase, YidC/Oxa1 family [Microbacterium laevaniformans OR221]EPD85856.1 preprotein translocase subunit YidC [Microbacterium sp. oral taxon 186 str. F0373]